MKKRWQVFICMLTVLVSGASVGHASGNAAEKLKRGVVNIMTAPVEIPKEVRAHWIKGSEKTFHISAWLLSGMIKGSVMTVARVGSGVWDVVSSPIALPGAYAPILRPAYVFDDWPRRQEGVIYKNIGDK